MVIGRIVTSNAHNNYVCHLDPQWQHLSPDSDEYVGLGDFVGIQYPGLGQLVGIVHDSQVSPIHSLTLLNRFSPYIYHVPDGQEAAICIKILIIGYMDQTGNAVQGSPLFIIPTGLFVEFLADKEILSFHGQNGKIRLTYLPYLKRLNPPLLFNVLGRIKEKLETLFPEQKDALTFLQLPYLWKDYF